MKRKSRNLTWAFLASVIVHLGLLLLLFNSGRGVGANNQGADNKGLGVEKNINEGISVEIITRKADTKEKKAFDKEADVEVGAPKVNIPEEDISRSCPYYFGGIGISYTALGLVKEVYAGYPAARAGILPGDILKENPERGEIGSSIEITVFRGERTLKFSLIREKVCISGRESIEQDKKGP